jgi:hypothetical protein
VTPSALLVEQLGRAFDAVADLISNIPADQWSAPTPCEQASAIERLVAFLGRPVNPGG